MKTEPMLNLTLIEGYKVTASTDDRGGSKLIGYFRDFNIAEQKAIKAGWYNEDGRVHSVVNLYTDGKINFLIDLAGDGKFLDDDEAYNAKLVASIKEKLTPEEWAILDQFK